MITKKEFCRMIINNFVRDNEIGFGCLQDNDLIPHVYSSTRLGIALEYLEVLTPESNKEAYEYIQSRGGIEYTFVNWDDPRLRGMEPLKTCILSTRELLELLPDSHVIIGGLYVCSRNKKVAKVTGLNIDPETGKLMVHYIECDTGIEWKPIEESEWFKEDVDEAGNMVPNFIYIGK